MGLTLIDGGSFTSDGASVDIALPGDANFFVTENLTQLATTQATGRAIGARWYKDQTAADNAILVGKENSSNITNTRLATSGGFTFYSSRPEPEAAVNGSAITRGATTTVTMTNTYSEGDTVILTDTTGMLQIGGMSFTISTVTGSNFVLAGLDSSGFAADGTDVNARRVPATLAFSPQFYYITKISQASSAVVTTSQAHNYVVDQLIHFSIPTDMGMQEMDQLSGVITAVGTYTFTVNINSSGFSAFAFPASTGSPASSLFATCAPAGARGSSNPINPFQESTFYPFIRLAAGAQSPAGSSGDVIEWQAFKYE